MASSKQQIWWDSLSQEIQDCISKALFPKKIFDLDKAYQAVGQFVR